MFVLMLALAAAPVLADGARSPEALAMAFVQAFRAGDIDALMSLHSNDDTHDRPRVRGAWRSLLRDYRLAGYRVSDLSGAERARLAEGQRNPTLLPIRKLVAQLNAAHSGEQRVLERYIGAENGRFYFVTPDAR